MRLYLLRHSLTQGNLEKRYLGCRCDEALCEEGVALAQTLQGHFPHPDKLLISPMRRCRETAEIVFPSVSPIDIVGLQECDFGVFEGKNYKELSQNEAYQAWIDSNGTLPFPGGESIEMFCSRCCWALEAALSFCKEDTYIAAVVHGGTIMAILSQLEVHHKPYFDCRLEPCQWTCCDVLSWHPLILREVERGEEM